MMGVVHNLILGGGGTSLPTTLNVTVSGGTATAVTASLGSRSVSLTYDSTSALWSATLPENATGNWTVTATDGSKTVSDLVAISGPGIWSMELTLGPLPSGYTELEYIESTGTQYIDTGYKANGDSCYAFSYSGFAGPSGVMFGAYNTTWETGSGLYANYNGDFWYHYYSNTDTGKVAPSSAKIQIEKGRFVCDGTQFTNLSSKTFALNYPTYLFCGNWSGNRLEQPTSYRLHYFQIYEADVAKRDFIPARRDSDSVLGMYDLVTNTFYTNAGTGTFVAGPEV